MSNTPTENLLLDALAALDALDSLSRLYRDGEAPRHQLECGLDDALDVLEVAKQQGFVWNRRGYLPQAR